MIKRVFKAAPLALLLLLPSASRARGEDGPREEREIVIADGDGVLTLDDDEPWILHHGPHARGHLGVRLIDITPELRAHYGAPRDAGVLVAGVEPDSPAAKAGLQVGDVLTRVDGDKIDSSRELSATVRRKKAGETVKVEVERDKAAKTLTVTIAERKTERIELGELRHRVRGGDWVSPHIDLKGPLAGRFESLEKLQEKLESLEKRMGDLEKKLR